MAGCRSVRATTRSKSHPALAITAVLALLMLLPVAGGTALAAGGVLSEQDKQCLGCHSSEGLEKKLVNGERLSLHIPGAVFAESVHNALGCAACHSNISLKSHPRARKKIGSTREYSVAQTGVCRACHEDKFKLYEESIHASLLREGNPIAPVCTDCHSPHAVRPKAARESIAEVPCRKCHSSIFDAYAESVHGQARGKPGSSNAPICADCHRAHDVMAASTGEQPKNACLGCHQGTLRAHQAWLPNAERHLEAVSCAACHAPKAQRKVDLRLYDNVAQKRVAEKEGVPQFETRARSADAKGVGLDAMALQSLLREFNRDGIDSKTTLRGRLEVRTGVETHQLTDKAKAIGKCDTCHREGADPFQSVTVSIVGPDGRPLRYGAQKEVLNSAISVDSVGGFYAIGGTRIKLLDILLALALLSGIAVPVGHMTLKWLFRRYARKLKEQEALANTQASGHPAAGDQSAGGNTPG
jgi:hypothetical protein